MSPRTPLILVIASLLLVAGSNVAAHANPSHAGWPAITGMLLMNKTDSDRPLDGRPGEDPFDGMDPSYSCDGLHHSTNCIAGNDVAFAASSLPCDRRHVESAYGLPT